MSSGIEGVLVNTPRINGRVQKAHPTFSRPRIDLDSAGNPIKRDWRSVAVRDLKAGDVVPGVGVLTEVHETVRMPQVNTLPARKVIDAVVWVVTVHGGDGNVKTYHGSDSVYAFTA